MSLNSLRESYERFLKIVEDDLNDIRHALQRQQVRTEETERRIVELEKTRAALKEKIEELTEGDA